MSSVSAPNVKKALAAAIQDVASNAAGLAEYLFIVTPEQHGGVGNGVADDSTALDDSFTAASGGILFLTPGKIYTHDTNIVVPSNITVIAVGAEIKKTSADQGPGHFVGINGDKTDIANPIPKTGINWFGGDINVNNFPGVNGVGIEVVDGLHMENVIARNAVHDPVTEGGRGFTRHGRSRNVSLVNCRSVNCSHGFDESWKSDNLQSVAITGATSVNPVVLTANAHGFTNGQAVHIQQMQGDFAALNGHEYVVAGATTNTFALTGADGSAYAVFTSGGVVSLADGGEQRNRNNSLIGCIADECPISALTMIQANNSRDLSLSSCDTFVQGFKAYNCGTQHTAEWGVINSSASVGLQGDIQVFNDAAHPVGAVFRGSMHKWSIDAIVDVHTCDSLIDATPLVGVNGLDAGVTKLPEGIMQDNRIDITFANEVLNTGVISTTDGAGDSIDNMYRNDFTVRLTRKDYISGAPFAGVLVSSAAHFTNLGRFIDLPSGRCVEFFFDAPVGFDQAGHSVSGLTIDNRVGVRSDLGLEMADSAASARISARIDGVLKGYLEYRKANDRWYVNIAGVDCYQLTASNILPSTDNDKDFGSAGLRGRTAYFGTGAINTSDEREKTELLALDATEQAVARELKGCIRKFQFLDAVERKGADARIHVGVGVQTVKAVFESHGLDPARYALFCYDEWEAEYDDDGQEVLAAGNRYGIRYEELLAFIVSSL